MDEARRLARSRGDIEDSGSTSVALREVSEFESSEIRMLSMGVAERLRMRSRIRARDAPLN